MRLHGHRSHAGASLSGAASKTDDELLILWMEKTINPPATRPSVA
jgi:hypothetical protein